MSRLVSGGSEVPAGAGRASARRGGRARRLAALACTAAAAGGGAIGLGAAPAMAAPTPFNPGSPSVFISQGSSTQLEQAVESNGHLVFQNVGPAAGFHYNALAYDPATNFLYAVVVAGGPGVGHVIQIDATGHATDTGASIGSIARFEDVGAFDPDTGDLYFGSSTTNARALSVYDPATNATSTLPLSSAPRAADLAYEIQPGDAQGYLWGIGSAGIVRVDPRTGTVTDFKIPPGLLPNAPNTVFGAAWTYGNGNLGFSNNSSGAIYQIAIADPSSATPTFTLVSSEPGPANSINDGASIPGQPVDLALSKTASPGSVTAGGQITYTLTVTNNGPGNSSGYVVSDPLPSGLVNAQTSTTGCSIAAGTLTCQGNPLPAGSSATITFTANAVTPDPSPITNTATVTGNEQDPDLTNNTASATVQPLPGADLAITKTAGSPTVLPGGQETYTLLVTNNGPDDASGVTVDDPLPAGETLVSAVPTQGTCAGTTCQLGSILNGGQAQILVTVDIAATATGAIPNTGTVSAATPDPNPANNTSTATVTVQGAVAPSPRVPVSTTADLGIVKRVDHARARPGQLLTYTILVTNHGPGSATGVTVTDTPQIPLTDVHATPGQGTCTTGRPLRCSLGTIANGRTVKIVVTGKAMRAGTEVNSASVASTSTDSTRGNNISRARTQVVAPAPTLRLRKTVTPKRITAGGSVTYRITVTSSGATAHNLKVCDALPLGLMFMSASPATRLTDGRECWTIRSLAAGRSRTLVLHARALMSTHGTLTNHATATATGTGTARAEARLTVTPPAATGKPPAGGVTG